MSKTDFETAVQDSTLCWKGPRGNEERKFSISSGRETKAKHKKQTRERGKRKRKPEQSEKGETKEPTKRLQEKVASTFSGTEDEKKADLKKSQAVEGVCDCGAKRLNSKLMMGTSHSTGRNTNILRREAGDKCCLETGKEDILEEKPEGKDTGLTRQGD